MPHSTIPFSQDIQYFLKQFLTQQTFHYVFRQFAIKNLNTQMCLECTYKTYTHTCFHDFKQGTTAQHIHQSTMPQVESLHSFSFRINYAFLSHVNSHAKCKHYERSAQSSKQTLNGILDSTYFRQFFLFHFHPLQRNCMYPLIFKNTKGHPYTRSIIFPFNLHGSFL